MLIIYFVSFEKVISKKSVFFLKMKMNIKRKVFVNVKKKQKNEKSKRIYVVKL